MAAVPTGFPLPHRPLCPAQRHQLGDYLPEDYGSYNEFFCRRIRPELRPLSNAALVSPCDGRASAYPITDDLRFTVKHTVYTVSSLLRNEALAQWFAGGTALVLRLAVDDYHRYCFPLDGTVGETGTIPGRFHTVQPIANDQYPIYKENTRQYTVFRSEELGDVAMVEVGALLVAELSTIRSPEPYAGARKRVTFNLAAPPLCCCSRNTSPCLRSFSTIRLRGGKPGFTGEKACWTEQNHIKNRCPPKERCHKKT